MPTLDDDSGSDREDELPQVVVLKSGDLTAEEVKKMKDEIQAGGSSEKGESPVQWFNYSKKVSKKIFTYACTVYSMLT